LTKRSIHYEAAFEDYLRARGIPYVATNESRRALSAQVSLKSVDFIFSTSSGENYLVEVKGKQFPYVRRGGRNYWESWLHREDISALLEWARILGPSFKALIVYVYHLTNPFDRRVHGPHFATLHHFRECDYALMGMEAAMFSRLSRLRSGAWDALDVAVTPLLENLRPFEYFLGVPEVVSLFQPIQNSPK